MPANKSNFLALHAVLFLVCGIIPGVSGQNETAKVIATTVFVTIIIILFIIAILWVILKRYQKVKYMRKVPRTAAVDNPAFSDTNEGDERIAVCNDIEDSPDKSKTLTSNNGPNSLNHQPWNSLPRVPLPSTNYGSYGSLNNSVGLQDSDIVSVNLVSQDFTGLGFDISGNMKDGIFIEEIRNRGPAKESQKLNPGDLIKDVTISFKNMVFKDALTILGYASPYPIKLTVQKRRQSPLRQSLNARAPIFHPLYRSHSHSALNGILKEPSARISYSDLKGHKKNPSQSSKMDFRKSANDSVLSSDDAGPSSNYDMLEVVVHPNTKSSPPDNQKVVPLNKDSLVKSQNPDFSLSSQFNSPSVDDAVNTKQDISNIEEKMDLHFSKYDQEFTNLKQEAEEKTSRLELETISNNGEKRGSLNSESEFAELEKSIRYSAHFSELYDRMKDPSSIPRFNSDKPVEEESISIATNEVAMTPNIKNQTTNVIPTEDFENITPQLKPLSFYSKNTLDKSLLPESLESEIIPTKKDLSLKLSSKKSPEIPTFDGNFSDLNEIKPSSTEKLLTTPLKFVSKQDDRENRFSKYLADGDDDDDDDNDDKYYGIIGGAESLTRDKSSSLSLKLPEASTKINLVNEAEETKINMRELESDVDAILPSDEDDENDPRVTKAKGLLSTDNDFKNKIWDRGYDTQNSVDTSFGLPMISGDQLTGGESNDNPAYLSTNIIKDNFLQLEDSRSLIGETDDSFSPQISSNFAQQSEEPSDHSSNDSISLDLEPKLQNHDMKIEVDRVINVQATNLNMNFMKEDQNPPEKLILGKQSNNKDHNTIDSSENEEWQEEEDEEEQKKEKGKEKKSEEGFFDRAMKKVRNIFDTNSPDEESSSNRNHSDLSYDSSQGNTPDLSDPNTSPRDIQISTDSDEEHNKKDEAFFEMTEDEQSTDTQSLSPKSTLINPISFKLNPTNDISLPTSSDVHIKDNINYIDNLGSQQEDSSPQSVDADHFDFDEDPFKSAITEHQPKINTKSMVHASQELPYLSMSDSSVSISPPPLDAKSKWETFETLNDTQPIKFEPKSFSITTDQSSSNHNDVSSEFTTTAITLPHPISFGHSFDHSHSHSDSGGHSHSHDESSS
ncbi:uncharacterized protein LOC115217417 isoform X1 [Argonauta hians]